MLTTILIVTTLSTGQTQEYDEASDTQFVNDSHIYMSASPAHNTPGTIREELIVKQYPDNITSVWLFDSNKVKPDNFKLFVPWNETITSNFSCNESFVFETSPNHLYCYITHAEQVLPNGTIPAYNQTLFNNTFDRWSAPSKTVFWDEIVEHSYKDLMIDLKPITFDFWGVDKGFVARNFNVKTGKMYETSFDLSMKLNDGFVDGKYYRCIMPSYYGRDIQQAKLDGKLDCLDPWYNASYTSKLPINCSEMSDGTPIIVNGTGGVMLNGSKQLIWTKCSGTGMAIYFNDKDDYVVSNDSDSLPFDVEIGDLKGVSPSVVWSDYEAVWHFGTNCSDLDASGNGHHINNQGTQHNTTGYIGGGCEFIRSQGDYMIVNHTASLQFRTKYGFEFYVKHTGIGNQNTQTFIAKRPNHDDGYWIRYSEGNGPLDLWTRLESTNGFITKPLAVGEWVDLDTTWTGAVSKWYHNGSKTGDDKAISLTMTATTDNLIIGDDTGLAGDWFWNGGMDEIRLKTVVNSDANISDMYNNTKALPGFGDTGEIEFNPPVGDTCTYSGSGDWTITDDCTIQADTDVDSNNIFIQANVKNNASITNFNSITSNGTFTNIEGGSIA